MLETVYLKGDPEEIKGLFPKLDSALKKNLENATVESIALEEAFEDSMGIPPVSPDEEWQASDYEVRAQLTPQDGCEVDDAYLDALSIQLINALNEVMKDHSNVDYFSYLDL